MRRRKESFAELLIKSPWWVSATMGVLAFIFMLLAPVIYPAHDVVSQAFTKEISRLAPLALIFFGILAAGSFWLGKKRRRLVDQQISLQSLQQTSWKDFEILVAEAFRRQGYSVDFSLGRGADGGVDLVLRKDGRKSLVQCKQWKVYSVGAPVIRETFGLMTDKNADEAVIVTTGRFTTEAQNFANGKSIQLIDGPQLLTLVQSVQIHSGPKESVSPAPASDVAVAPACPSCGKPMVVRIARRGNKTGGKFWGCKDFPGCTGTREI